MDCPDDEHVLIGAPDASARVTFYELDPGAPEIVELSAAPVDDPDNPTFFLHFEMDDLAHAQQLFGELLGALSEHALAVRLEKADTRLVREMNQDRRVLVITSV